MQDYDVIIIGAGAAGLMCAIEAGKRGQRTLLLEHTSKIGEKIRISGGGRCNFTNLGVQPARFISQNPHFCKSALSRYTQHDFIGLVNRYKIAWHEKTLGQLFCDGSAQQIIDMLQHECDQAGVTIRRETAVETIEKTAEGFSLATTAGQFCCTSLVIATGGPSIPKMGATGFAYQVAKQFGLNIIEPRAALVPLTFTDDILTLTKELSGVAVDPSQVGHGKTSFREAVLFTHRGLSGPAILQISSYWREGETITLNLCPDRDIFAWLKKARTQHPKKMLHTMLQEMLPQRLADKIAARTAPDSRMGDLNDVKLRLAADHIQNWTVKPNGSEGYRTAEVTRGGIDTNELSSQTFAAKKVPGLHFIGEAVDVTGWLGGYNFQWAWSSGWCCGQSV